MLINYQGTLPFASLQVLRWAEGGSNKSGITHTVADDLELFFYVFIWLCMLYDGPGGVLRPPPEDDGFIAHAWGEGGMGPGGITLILNAKICFIYSPGNSIIDTQFTLYFENLKPLAKEWKQLVKMEDERREAKHSTPMYTHKDVIALLHKYADNLPDFDSFPCPVPSTQLPQALEFLTMTKPPPPSPSKQFSKWCQYNSLESVGMAWAPKKTD